MLANATKALGMIALLVLLSVTCKEPTSSTKYTVTFNLNGGTGAITLIPLSEALVLKGMGIGAVMAFIIGSSGVRLPEVILLKAMFKN